MLRLFRALSAVLFLLAIALVSALVAMRLAIHGTEVRVPVLSGTTLPEAVARLHARSLEMGVDGRFYSTTQIPGVVLTQSPPPGTLVRKSWRVRVTESLGPQKVAIPSVDGMDESIATLAIRRAGLKIGNIAAMPSAYAPENTIIAQTPIARSTDVQGPKVGLLAAMAPLPIEEASVMPDLIGESFTAAALAVIHAGFTLAPLQSLPVPRLPGSGPMSIHGKATGAAATAQGPSISVPPLPQQTGPPAGTVVAQNPEAGSRIVAGATVQLTVQP